MNDFVTVAGLMESAKQTARKLRSPVHTFNVRQKPFTIQPICIAPVLPGETMKSLLFQERTVTDPINNGLIGWHNEVYFFYVKMSDFDNYYEASDFRDMFLDPAKDMSAYNAAAAFKTYHAGPNMDWTNECLKVVTKHWFREESEAWNVVTIDGMPAAKVQNQMWLDSLLDETLVTEGTAPGAGETEEVMEENYRNYLYLKQMQLVDMDYEDFLRTYGVSIPKAQEIGRPEMLRMFKDWQYPTNTVEPTTGIPASAVSWVTQFRADKDRFFKEPGFIFGVQVVRPKTYFGRVYGAGASMMNSGLQWFPAIMKDDVWTSLREYAAASGPLNGDDASEDPTNGYIVDVRDLLIHGDQFMNYENSATNADKVNQVQLPTAALEHLYPSETDVDSFFVSGSAEYVRSDGIVSIKILGAQTDHTPRSSGGI